MNPFKHSVTCAVCGESGQAHVRHAGSEWLGAQFTHSNPMVCAANIKRREELWNQRNEKIKRRIAILRNDIRTRRPVDKHDGRERLNEMCRLLRIVKTTTITQ